MGWLGDIEQYTSIIATEIIAIITNVALLMDYNNYNPASLYTHVTAVAPH